LPRQRIAAPTHRRAGRITIASGRASEQAFDAGSEIARPRVSVAQADGNWCPSDFERIGEGRACESVLRQSCPQIDTAGPDLVEALLEGHYCLERRFDHFMKSLPIEWNLQRLSFNLSPPT
jgi:hypothetical protein